jgi:hypothetical protein
VPDDESFTAAATAAFLLDDVTYEDDQGLWEIVWTLNGQFPDKPLACKVELAREAVRLLGPKIELWRGRWPEGPLEPLTEAEADSLVADDLPWYDPERASQLIWVRLPGRT